MSLSYSRSHRMESKGGRKWKLSRKRVHITKFYLLFGKLLQAQYDVREETGKSFVTLNNLSLNLEHALSFLHDKLNGGCFNTHFAKTAIFEQNAL